MPGWDVSECALCYLKALMCAAGKKKSLEYIPALLWATELLYEKIENLREWNHTHFLIDC